MVKQIQAAQKAARKAIEATYFGTLTVTELQKVKNEKSKLMEESEVVVLQDQPCRLSFEKLQTAIQSESAATITQSTKLFVSPDVTIKAGIKTDSNTGQCDHGLHPQRCPFHISNASGNYT